MELADLPKELQEDRWFTVTVGPETEVLKYKGPIFSGWVDKGLTFSGMLLFVDQENHLRQVNARALDSVQPRNAPQA